MPRAQEIATRNLQQKSYTQVVKPKMKLWQAQRNELSICFLSTGIKNPFFEG
jgi:hypothetical protein